MRGMWWMVAMVAAACGGSAVDVDTKDDDDTEVVADTRSSPTDSDTDLGEPPADCSNAGDDITFPSVPTWFDDVAPILYDRCVACHVAGGSGPFPLTTFAEARVWAPAMREAVHSRAMPPPGPTSCGACNRFSNATWLSPREIATVRAWSEGGTPEGTTAPLPELPDARAGLDRTDLIVRMPATYEPRLDVNDEYRCFLLDTGLTEDMYITGFDIRPGDRRVVHHAILFTLREDASVDQARAKDAADPRLGYPCFGGTGVDADAFVAGWAPGIPATQFPEGTGVVLPANRPLVLQVHYNLAGGALPDRSGVGLKLEREVNKRASIRQFNHQGFRLPPGEAYVEATGRFQPLSPDYDGPMTIWGIIPHMHTLGRTLRAEAVNVDTGEVKCLAQVDTFDFDNQGLFFYEEPVIVKGNAELRVTCGWDTTTRVTDTRSGDETTDEMCVAILYATRGLPADARTPSGTPTGDTDAP